MANCMHFALCHFLCNFHILYICSDHQRQTSRSDFES
ncbi:hypothetical protein M758_8G089600 [Ceratodon purpureus]|uniref:Uncharacterized protein n=1 Tax=Ceratodon purpureus TaxID=3225 RepID=A0A8T0H092_CERPU|nr:hypothetical protein KC19_8G093800 [Ceratodon purpureus]KAG0608230.1 hypothetical protein M758_8G089600 [Ceratodon purpureus]